LGHGDVAVWFGLVFAVGIALALLFREVRVSRQRKAPVVRRDRELAIERASRRPRAQHYAFAHRLLRDAALDDPEGTWDAVTKPGSGDFLVDMWIHAKPEDEDLISPEGLRVDVEGDIAIVTLPPPERLTEAYMIALVRRGASGGAYFVLERGAESAYLAEWRKDTRIRMGNVAPPTKRELVAAIRAARGER
jgi:hypothetical protein